MECKKKCYWNYNNQCCPESKEGIEQANPKFTETCPTYLRKDFEEHLFETHDNITHLLRKRNCEELEQIEKFILSQREEQK